MKNDGKDAESAFEEHWTKVGHCERVRDARDLMGLNGGKRVADFKKPSDFLVSSRVHPLHFAEVKSTVDAKRFSFDKIQSGQANAAQREYLQGSGSYIFYIFSYPLGRWFIMPCAVYAHQLKMGRKSISFEELDPWIK